MELESVSREKTFKTQQIFRYYLFGVISIVSLLTLISFLLKYNLVDLVPEFLEPILVKHDWLGIIYFSFILFLLSLPIVIIPRKYKWFCQQTSYYITNNTLAIVDNKRNIRIQIKDIKEIRCQIKPSLFPMSSKRATKERIYKHYKLCIETANSKYIFYSIPFQTEEEEFRHFMEDLRAAGLNFEIKTPISWNTNRYK